MKKLSPAKKLGYFGTAAHSMDLSGVKTERFRSIFEQKAMKLCATEVVTNATLIAAGNGPTKRIAAQEITEKHFHERSEAERPEITSILTDQPSIIRAKGKIGGRFLPKRRNISFDDVRERGRRTKDKIMPFIMVKLEIESEVNWEYL
jgi:hypothetical protein